MSKPSSGTHAPSGHGAGHGGAPASVNEDGVNMTKIIVVGVVSLVIFAISAVIAGIIVNADEVELGTRGIAPLPADITKKEEIGIVDYVLFDGDTRLAKWKAERKKTGESYGWVDRKKGLIHIPIEQAMKDVVREAGGGGQ